MNKFLTTIFLNIVFSATILPFCFGTDISWHASGNGGIVAAGPKSSVQAGLDMLEMGGNAVDAAVAVLFNLAVADYGSFCIGGEVPFMFYNANSEKVTVFNGMGGAPKDKEAIDWFYANGIPKERRGIKLSTVPSAISTCMKALEENGTLSFEQIIKPTIDLLDAGGQDWYPALAGTFRMMVETEKNSNGNREEKIRAARDRFYKGDIADELNAYYIKSGGFLRKTDLETHVTIVEEPVVVNFRGYSVHKCNTWTQGPVLLQSLRLLEKFDLKSMGHLSPDYIHVTTEAMKLAFADRDKYYGDPNYTDVPLKELLSDQYTRIRLPLIDMHKASHVIRPGDPISMTAFHEAGQYWPGETGTTTCVVIDKWGNAVAATPSSNGDYGICPGLGIAHNTRLTSFNTEKGHPNSLQAGKRPRITLTPTIVLKNGKPFLVMSVAGGDIQDQVSLQLLLNVVEFGMQPIEAICSPRFNTCHTEDSFNPAPDPINRINKIATLETDSTSKATLAELEKRGHIINTINGPIAYPVMVYFDQATKVSYAATEPLYYRVNNRGKFCGAINKSIRYKWEHLSTAFGDLPVPNEGNQQTATLVMDVDNDGINDFIITERTKAPSVVWYRRTPNGWDRYIIDNEPLPVEAGSAFTDITGNGYKDIVFGGDSRSNQVWWWENPGPDYNPDIPWKRRYIKNSGARKHHNQLFGDFDGDGKQDLVFWNQGVKTLFFAKIPDNPREAEPWIFQAIYEYSSDSEMESRGTYPSWRGTNEHEGLTKIDIDGDGKLDIVGGGRWFKHMEGNKFMPNIIDASYSFTVAGAGDFIQGGRPEVLLVAGDGTAPLVLYEWQKGVWKSKILIDVMIDAHSMTVLDFNGDGHLDIFSAEMQLGKNPEPKTHILLGDGKGNFDEMIVHTGFGLHESVLIDLTGNGLPDILGKPYTWNAPRLDIWLNKGPE